MTVDSPYVLIIYRKDKANTGVNKVCFILDRTGTSGISAQAAMVLSWVLEVTASTLGLNTGCPDLGFPCLLSGPAGKCRDFDSPGSLLSWRFPSQYLLIIQLLWILTASTKKNSTLGRVNIYYSSPAHSFLFPTHSGLVAILCCQTFLLP
jgi:hypothetical protein